MDFGVILPSYRDGATVESIDAATDAAARLGWHSVFTTDHVLVDISARSQDYANIFDPIVTLAHVAARQPSLRVGISVVVVPMRNAVILAKELATVDALSDGRLIVGAGVGWNQKEFGYLGEAERFARRGAYLDESIAIWRQLWSGSTAPFDGKFHKWDEVRFGPLPPQGENVPVWLGGRDERALRRVGRAADGYHSTTTSPAQYAERIPVIRDAAEVAGRPMPTLSARARVVFGQAGGPAPFYQLSGTPEKMVRDVRAFAEIGVSHIAVDFAETDPGRCVALVERFDTEVCAALR
jgi:probable F420-dependent oxidoreductase